MTFPVGLVGFCGLPIPTRREGVGGLGPPPLTGVGREIVPPGLEGLPMPGRREGVGLALPTAVLRFLAAAL